MTPHVASEAPTLVLYEQPGYGSVLIEAQLAFYSLPVELRRAGDILTDGDARARLTHVNPVAQIPALVTGDGTLVTETAAITLWLAEVYGTPERNLAPPRGSTDRAAFLRWLTYWVASPYAVFTYLDRSAEYVPDPAARAGFEAALRSRLGELIGVLNQQAAGPWFLGERFSALDIYTAVFSEWTPGPDWYAVNAPALASIARRVWDIEALKTVHARNFKPAV